MNTVVAHLTSVVRRPFVQDAGLAALLLVASIVMSDTDAAPTLLDPRIGLQPVGSLLWWVLAGAGIASVLVRRRWPEPALACATVAALVQMAVAMGPMPANVAVPLILFTIAAGRSRTFSLWILAAMMLVVLAWSVYVTFDGRRDGWLIVEPFTDGRAAPAVRPEPPVLPELPVPPEPPEPPVPPVPPEPDPSVSRGPTDWGGIPILAPVLVAAWAIGWSVQSRRAYLDELKARARDLERERDQQGALAAAAERTRITRELHDVVAHGLSVIVMQAQGGVAAFEKRPQATLSALNTIVETGRASLADMRQVLAAVGPVDGSRHPVPGLAQLPKLVEQVRKAGTPVLLHLEGEPDVLPITVDLAAYRIVQEALTNAMKHAGPGARVQVTIEYGKDALTVEVNDNGAGDAVADGAGNGLRGMRERVETLRGELFAGPVEGKGFSVRARLPLGTEATL
ncbi:sensor histidine kinase [Tenggerimyces flavus]|uniref:histidine kinase n=1 Tax=Tenggerimyces flavus TaxID=1708749 RepID=A0ABV7Y9J2_9ACTN|nr:sensor histidine kinase [Tenggerimyces flavus]MBM7783793.1 signal transduction histidine kinase [Tenggerimyces flavus]